MRLTDLACACGCRDIIAIAPGHAPQHFRGFVLERGAPMRVWCEPCWRRAFASEESAEPRPSVPWLRKTP